MVFEALLLSCDVLLENQLDAELQKYLDNAQLLHYPARAIIAPYPEQQHTHKGQPFV